MNLKLLKKRGFNIPGIVGKRKKDKNQLKEKKFKN